MSNNIKFAFKTLTLEWDSTYEAGKFHGVTFSVGATTTTTSCLPIIDQKFFFQHADKECEYEVAKWQTI